MKELNEAYQAFIQHGTKADAARALGIPRTTFNDRYERAIQMFARTLEQPKITLIDFEISQIISGHYDLFNINVNKDDILHDWFAMSFSWKWRGEETVQDVNMMHDMKRFKKNRFDIRDLFFDDYHIIKTAHDVLMEADVIVFQNGVKFDLKKFNTRARFHGLPPIGKKILIDTYLIAKRHFAITSNSLDYMCTFFGIPTKIKKSHGLFRRAMLCEPDAIRELSEYNKYDVWPCLEGVFNKLLPYVENLNMNLFSPDTVCKNCGSHNLEEIDQRVYTKTTVKAQCRCGDCQSLTTIGKSLKTVVAR